MSDIWFKSTAKINDISIDVACNNGVFYFRKNKRNSLYDRVEWSFAQDQKLAKSLFFSGIITLETEIDEIESNIYHLKLELEKKKKHHNELMSIKEKLKD